MNEKPKDRLQNSENDKIGINFYIKNSTLEKIEDFLFLIKKRLPIEKRRKLTRSVFYEIGLNMAIEDFNKKGEESSLWKAIQEQLSG
jgi:deoxyhypusine synthase